MSPHFIPLLREAHAVYMAHSVGNRTIGEIAAHAHLSIGIAASWCSLLKLPVTAQPGCIYDFKFHAQPERYSTYVPL